MGEGEGGEKDGLTRQSNLLPRISMHSSRTEGDFHPRGLFFDSHNCGADLAHQVLQNPWLSWRSDLTDSQPASSLHFSRCGR
jgi:hypothetical protein